MQWYNKNPHKAAAVSSSDMSHDRVGVGFTYPVWQMWHYELRQAGEHLLQQRTMIQLLVKLRTSRNCGGLNTGVRSWEKKSRGVSFCCSTAHHVNFHRGLCLLYFEGASPPLSVQPTAHLQKPNHALPGCAPLVSPQRQVRAWVTEEFIEGEAVGRKNLVVRLGNKILKFLWVKRKCQIKSIFF